MDQDIIIHLGMFDKKYEKEPMVMNPLSQNTRARQQFRTVTMTEQTLLTAEFNLEKIPKLTFNSDLDGPFSKTVLPIERKDFLAGSPAVCTATVKFFSPENTEIITFQCQQHYQAGGGGPTVVRIETTPFNSHVQIFLQPVWVDTQTGQIDHDRSKLIELQQGTPFAEDVVLAQNNKVLLVELYAYY